MMMKQLLSLGILFAVLLVAKCQWPEEAPWELFETFAQGDEKLSLPGTGELDELAYEEDAELEQCSTFVPFYRYWNGREHFYTTNIDEIGTGTPGQVGKHGYKSEGIACFIRTCVTGTVPLYRYWNGREHFYTTDANEIGVTRAGQRGNHGYVSEGIAGYCNPSSIGGTKPLYRYWNGAEHFYTTNSAEIGTTVPGQVGRHNYRSEGIACYVY